MPCHPSAINMKRSPFPDRNVVAHRAPQQRSDGPTADYQRGMRGSQVAPSTWAWGVLAWGCVSIIAMGIPIHGSRAEELEQLPTCSASTAGSGGLQSICNVTALPAGRHKVKVNLTAQTGMSLVGGYSVETERYN